MTKINPKLLHVPSHLRDSRVSSTLSENLREQYGCRSCRVIKGDGVRVVRGEYSGIEGKVEKVNTQKGTLSIERFQALCKELADIPEKVELVLQQNDAIKALAEKYKDATFSLETQNDRSQ